jgi:hypothetical protein
MIRLNSVVLLRKAFFETLEFSSPFCFCHGKRKSWGLDANLQNIVKNSGFWQLFYDCTGGFLNSLN